VGTVQPVLIEGRSEESELLLRGRLAFQAPDVDGMVYVANPPDHFRVGSIVDVRVTQAADYDVVAEPA
jgi:ribosomal protein S12 methylthiotransferase